MKSITHVASLLVLTSSAHPGCKDTQENFEALPAIPTTESLPTHVNADGKTEYDCRDPHDNYECTTQYDLAGFEAHGVVLAKFNNGDSDYYNSRLVEYPTLKCCTPGPVEEGVAPDAGSSEEQANTEMLTWDSLTCAANRPGCDQDWIGTWTTRKQFAVQGKSGVMTGKANTFPNLNLLGHAMCTADEKIDLSPAITGDLNLNYAFSGRGCCDEHHICCPKNAANGAEDYAWVNGPISTVKQEFDCCDPFTQVCNTNRPGLHAGGVEPAIAPLGCVAKTDVEIRAECPVTCIPPDMDEPDATTLLDITKQSIKYWEHGVGYKADRLSPDDSWQPFRCCEHGCIAEKDTRFPAAWLPLKYKLSDHDDEEIIDAPATPEFADPELSALQPPATKGATPAAFENKNFYRFKCAAAPSTSAGNDWKNFLLVILNYFMHFFKGF